jgi:hypothetical protein
VAAVRPFAADANGCSNPGLRSAPSPSRGGASSRRASAGAVTTGPDDVREVVIRGPVGTSPERCRGGRRHTAPRAEVQLWIGERRRAVIAGATDERALCLPQLPGRAVFAAGDPGSDPTAA